MDKSAYEKISMVLKISAKIVGVILIAYGCIVGVFGLGPDGPTTLIGWRSIGLFILLQGILCFLPNSKIKDNFRFLIFYLVATLLPVLIIIAVTFLSIITNGMESFAKTGGLTTVAVLFPISMFAPLSLIFSVLGKKSVES